MPCSMTSPHLICTILMLGGIIVAMIFRHFVHLGNGHTQIEESFSGIDSEEQLTGFFDLLQSTMIYKQIDTGIEDVS
jgi:hypothetical protein